MSQQFGRALQTALCPDRLVARSTMACAKSGASASTASSSPIPSALLALCQQRQRQYSAAVDLSRPTPLNFSQLAFGRDGIAALEHCQRAAVCILKADSEFLLAHGQMQGNRMDSNHEAVERISKAIFR